MTAPDAPPSAHHQGLRDAVAKRMATDRDADDFPAAQLDAIDVAVRRRTSRAGDSNLAGRMRALQAAADIDVAPPVASDHRGGRGVKLAIAKVTGWYVGHLAVQVRELGVASARAVRALASRIDEIERRIDALEQRDTEGEVR